MADRFDICEAYALIEMHYNAGGWLQERPSNVRRMESTDVQLHRIGFKPGAAFGRFSSLTEDGQDLYRTLQRRYGFPVIHATDDCEHVEPGDTINDEDGYVTCEDCCD